MGIGIGTVQSIVLSTSSNDSKLLIRASSAHRYVVKMDRCRVVRVSGTLYDRVFCLFEVFGGLCVLDEF